MGSNGGYRFFVLRGRPTLRSFSASRSFGLISHILPTFVAFKRFAVIIFSTLLVDTFKRFAASAVPMIFMGQVYHSEKMSELPDKIL